MARKIFVVMTLIVVVFFVRPAAHARASTYVLIALANQPLLHPHAPRKMQVIPRYRQPYAYGWFGAQPHRHGDIHYGYRQHYIEWSLR